MGLYDSNHVACIDLPWEGSVQLALLVTYHLLEDLSWSRSTQLWSTFLITHEPPFASQSYVSPAFSSYGQTWYLSRFSRHVYPILLIGSAFKTDEISALVQLSSCGGETRREKTRNRKEALAQLLRAKMQEDQEWKRGVLLNCSGRKCGCFQCVLLDKAKREGFPKQKMSQDLQEDGMGRPSLGQGTVAERCEANLVQFWPEHGKQHSLCLRVRHRGVRHSAPIFTWVVSRLGLL